MNASIERAKPTKLFYVVANVILVNVMDRSCLLLRRSNNEKEAGGKWAFPGGKAEHRQIINGRMNNFFGVVALAECQEETRLTFDPAKTQIIANGAFVRTDDGIPVVWATLAAPYEGGKVSLEAGSFSDYSWFNEADLPTAEDCIGTVREEAVAAIRTLST